MLDFSEYIADYKNLRHLLSDIGRTNALIRTVEVVVKKNVKIIKEIAERMGLDISCEEGRNMASAVRKEMGVWLDGAYKNGFNAYTCQTDWWTLRRKVSDMPLYWPIKTGTFKGLTLKCRVNGGSGDGWRLKDYTTKSFNNGYNIHTFSEEDIEQLLTIKSLIAEIEGLTHEEEGKKHV
jgi:hypothetical protein